MNKTIKLFITLLIPLTLILGLSFILPFHTNAQAVAEETEATVTESAYAKFWINDLGGYASDGATRDAKTGNITNVNSYGRFGYNIGINNMEVSTKINFSTKGNTTFIMRASGDTLLPAGHSGWTNSGYFIRLYSNARYDFVKGSTVVHSAIWPPHSGFTTGVDHLITIKIVDLSDGNVKISLTVDNILFFEHIDDTDKISGTWFAVCSEGSVFSASGEGFKTDAINLNDVATPTTSSNFPATIDENGIVTTSANAVSSKASGVAYTFQTTDFYTFKTKVTPSSTSGNFTFTIGSYRTNSHAMNKDDVVSANWGWTETGYVLKWSGNGQRHIYRNASLVEYVWNLPSFTANQTYEIEYGITPFEDGSNRIHFKIDGNLKVIYFDKPTADYTPLSLTSAGGTPASLNRTSLVLSYGNDATITPCEKTSYETKTILNSQLGKPQTATASTFDRNGGISSLTTGRVAGYKDEFQNHSIKMKAKFLTAGTYLILSLRSEGSTFDTPWGSSWTNKGYSVYLYANGQTILNKNGKKICEGWSLSSKKLTADTEFIIEFGTIDISDDAVRVFATINGSPVVNYLDTNSALKNSGWFTIFNDDFTGSIQPYGVEIPAISSSAIDNTCKEDDTISLSAFINDSESQSATFYIDENLSTASATLSGNTLTPQSAGQLVIYGMVNGIYSEDLILTVEEGLVATVVDLPTQPIIVGGETYTVGYDFSGDSVESVAFSIENLSGSATINAETGEITGVSAGQVKVYVTINGVKSQGYLISISPKIEIGNSTALAVGEVRNLGYSANCPLPDEKITTVYELISGNEFVEFDSQTGQVTAKAIGVIKVRVTVTGETFQAISNVVGISIEAPIVTLPNVKDMYVGQTTTLHPQINKGLTIQSKEIVVVSGGSHVSINGDKITATSKGTVKIKAVINGYESAVIPFEITDLTATLIATDMPTEATQTLRVMLNFEEVEIESVVYSIERGEEFATLENDILSTLTQKGQVELKAVIAIGEKQLIAKATISIIYKVRLTGMETSMNVGDEIQLSYFYYYDEEITSIEYVLVDGKELATLSENGTLKINKPGTIKVKVIVNGVESKTETIKATVNHNKLGSIIVWGSSGIIAGVALITVLAKFLKKRKKLKLANTQSSFNKTNTEDKE